MDFQRIKAQLNKIDRTVDMIEADGQITKLEIDLLKDYIKKLYELTLSEDAPVRKPTASAKEPTKERAPVSNGTEKDEIVSAQVNGKSEAPAQEETKAPASEEVAVDQEVPEEVLALFEEQEATELSEKLSQLAINDIEKSMSINEKIFTINELFNGNSQEFRNCLEKLNGMSDYDEAVSYLSKEVATPYEWSDKSKVKKALNFIQLVNRKFQ